MKKYMITYKIDGIFNMTNKVTRVEAKDEKSAVSFLKKELKQINVKIKIMYVFEIK